MPPHTTDHPSRAEPHGRIAAVPCCLHGLCWCPGTHCLHLPEENAMWVVSGGGFMALLSSLVENQIDLNPGSSQPSKSSFSYGVLSPCVRNCKSWHEPCCGLLFISTSSRFVLMSWKSKAETDSELKSETNKVGCDINFSSSLGKSQTWQFQHLIGF